MPIQDGKYVTPAWQNGGPPAIDAAELTDIGNSIVKNQTNILTNTQNIQTNQQNIETLQSTVQNINENYLNKTGDTMSGQLNMGGNIITNLGTPSGSSDAVTKSYADNLSKLNWTLLASQYFNLSYNGTNSMEISGISPIYAANNPYKAILVYADISTFSWTNTSGYKTVGINFDQIPLVTTRIDVDDKTHSIYGVTCVALLTKKVIVCKGNSADYTTQWQSFEFGSNDKLNMAYSSVGRISVSSSSSYKLKAAGYIYVYYLN